MWGMLKALAPSEAVPRHEFARRQLDPCELQLCQDSDLLDCTLHTCEEFVGVMGKKGTDDRGNVSLCLL